ncbi:hypothetical protein RUM44_002631 [Polyplax serrata]|uniref:Uncharacterized protein n=1 Tax=Polyplax serrata TaxID=468196 RepID=A0ABR1AFB4_POLSC
MQERCDRRCQQTKCKHQDFMESRNEFLTDFSKICGKFADRIAVCWAPDVENTQGITYHDLDRVSSELSRYFCRNSRSGTRYIAVEASNYFLLPCLLLGIWKSGRSFAGIGTQYTVEDTKHFMNFLNVEYLITDKCESRCLNESANLISQFQIDLVKFYFWKRNIPETEKGSDNGDMCYGIMTSGTTGLPKIIQVPWSCILLNIDELQSEFQVSETDCIYLGSPYTFDPFFVEFFSSLLYGCTLMTVFHTIKLSPSMLMKILFSCDENKDARASHELSYDRQENENSFYVNKSYVCRKQVTILQMTPTLFKRWGEDNIKQILSNKTSLRMLILGGEKFPIEILKFKACNNKTKIYNIYGITEVSCWAFLNEVTQEEFDQNEVTLGKQLKNIIYKINEKNELIIGSYTRHCLVNGEKESRSGKPVFRNTGDIVGLDKGKLYYLSRSNQIVKKFGIKISLNKIEQLFLMLNPSLVSCFCVFDEQNQKLGLFYQRDTKLSANSYRLTSFDSFTEMGLHYDGDKLKDIEKPDYLIEIFDIPLNSHGKCDRNVLLRHLQGIHSGECYGLEFKDLFKNIWNDVLGLRNLDVSTKSFEELGGTSVSALQLINKLQDEGVTVPKNFIVELLSGKSQDRCFECLGLEETESTASACRIPNKKIKMEINEAANADVKLKVKWKFDLGKCVDATPAIFTLRGRDRLVVGSHSYKLSVTDLETGVPIWTVFLGGRIESGVAVKKDGSCGYVGCYDRFIYCISMEDGLVLWKYETGDMVKSTPCLSSEEEVLFAASYDRCLYCLSADKGDLLKQIQLSDKGIFSSGVVSTSNFFIGTLDGTCVALCQNSCDMKWKKKLESPVFASPCLLPDNKIIFIEVVGSVHCFNATDGSLVWRYLAGGMVYSTPIHRLGVDDSCVLFGCNDGCLYCLEASSGSLKWTRQMDSSVFARPCVFALDENEMVCAASSKGFLYLLDLTTGLERRTKAACFWCPGHLEGGRFGYSDGIKKHNKDFPRLFRIASVDIGEDELNCSICALKTSNLGLVDARLVILLKSKHSRHLPV